MAKTIICPHSKCNDEVKVTTEDARRHVRIKHPKLTDKSKIALRNKICPFVDTSGFRTSSRNKLENFLTRSLGIK